MRPDLSAYTNFQESLLLDFWSDNLLRDIVALVSSIWNEPRVMRKDLGVHDLYTLRFLNCRSFTLENIQVNWDTQGEANWGLAEFSVLRAEAQASGLMKYSFLWEGDRSIEIICSGLVIEKTENTPELEAKYRFPKLNARERDP